MLWIGQFPLSPQATLSSIRGANVKFLYLHHTRDIEELQEDAFIQQLVKTLPVEFNNSDVTIYSIPPLHTPSSFSPVGIIASDETLGASYDAYALWFLTFAMSNYSYTVYSLSDLANASIFESSQVLLLPYDPPLYARDVAKLLEWVTNGGELVVSNTNVYGTFAQFFGIGSEVPFLSCDSTDNWSTFFKRGEILLEAEEKIEGISSLRLRNNSSSWEAWTHTPQEPWNLSEYEYLGISVYGTGGGPQWYLYLVDSSGRRSYFRYDLSRWDSKTQTYIPNFLGWKLHLIPIKEYYGDLNLTSIERLYINTGFQMPVNMLIDDIFLLEENIEGNPVVIANGIEGKETINLPSVGVQKLSLSEETRVAANYTKDGLPVAPFAIQKNLGDGRVTYLNTNLLYEFVLSETGGLISLPETFTKILESIDIELTEG